MLTQGCFLPNFYDCVQFHIETDAFPGEGKPRTSDPFHKTCVIIPILWNLMLFLLQKPWTGHSCHDMCKSVTWLYHQYQNKAKNDFYNISVISFLKWAQGPYWVTTPAPVNCSMTCVYVMKTGSRGICCHNARGCVRTVRPIPRPRDWTYCSHKP